MTVSIHDHGRGLAHQQLKVIFEPYRQVQHHRKNVEGGLGLGLAISKAIIEVHGGMIWAESEGLGRGAIFHIKLAICLPPTKLSAPPQEVSPTNNTMKILIVEDDLSALQLFAEQVRRLGYLVTTASTLAEAKALDPACLNLVITDCNLGDGSSQEVAQHFKELRQSLPVIAVSGQSETTATSHTFDAYLTKPVNLTTLGQVLERFKASGTGCELLPTHSRVQ